MSLHAQISAEAQAALNAQKKTSTISSVIISVLAILLLGLILYVISLTIASKVNPEIFAAGDPLADTDEPIDEPTETEVTKKPASSSSSAVKLLTALTNSPDSIPIPTTDTTDLSLDFGYSLDFGDGSIGNGNESGSGAGNPFGGTQQTGTIGGYFYDFKQSRAGIPKKKYNTANRDDFTRPVKRFQRQRFKASALKKHFKSEKELFVRYIAIPPSNADSGPRFFGLQDKVKPSGWMVHYSGKVTAPKTGRFRLVGVGDDYLGVALNGKAKLIASWTDIQSALKMRGSNAKEQPNHSSPFSINLVYGDWFNVKAGEEIQLDIGIGERPGGGVGFLLMIEEEGASYENRADGSSVLPPFAMGKLHKDDISQLKSYPNWKFKLDDVPIFQAVD